MRTVLILAAGVGLAACGCGDRTVSVTGTVTVNGDPVCGGYVILVGSDGIVRDGPIGPDGKYVVYEIAVGAVQIGVTGPRIVTARSERMPDGGQPSPYANGEQQVPAKYGNPLTSGLTGTVVAGKPLDVALT